jgi:competence protein ComEA
LKNWWQIPFGVVCGLLGAGLLYLLSREPPGTPIPLQPPPAPLPISVHVAGAVTQPGLYTLPVGARVEDALDAAGGALPQAELDALNLAAVVQDGERIWVPEKFTEPTASLQPPTNSQRSPPIPLNTPTGLVNLNTATQSELESLPDIGPVTAAAIITYRQQHGPFTRLEDLDDVSGIGPTTFEKIKDLITIGGMP